jgi:hypothetical protein
MIYPVMLSLLGDNDFQLSRPLGFSGAVPSDYTYIATNVVNNSFSVSPSGYVIITGTGMGTMQLVKVSDSSVAYSGTLMITNWMIPSKNIYDADFQLSIPGFNSTGYEYVADNVTNGAFSVSTSGFVTINNAAGAGNIKVKNTTTLAVKYSTNFTVTNDWPAAIPRALSAGDYVLAPPPSMLPENGAITYSMGWLMPGDTNEVFSIIGAKLIHPIEVGSREISASQGIGQDEMIVTVTLFVT